MAEERIFSNSSSSPMFFTRLRFVIKGQLQSIRAVPANTRAGISRKAKNRFLQPEFLFVQHRNAPSIQDSSFPAVFHRGSVLWQAVTTQYHREVAGKVRQSYGNHS